MTIIALDIGGTGSRAAIRGDHEITLFGPGADFVDGHVSYETALDALAKLIDVQEPAAVVAIGAAGLMVQGNAAEVAANLARRWMPERLVVASDAVTSLVGAWGLAGGAVVAAGTGVVALGSDLSNTWRRVDGWGPWIGDRGGGAWIGAQGIDAAMRRTDGRRGGSSWLRDAAHTRYGALDQLPTRLRRASNPAAVLAGFVSDVVSAADAGDEVALSILTEGARHLSDAASAVLDSTIPPRVALVGGISRIDLIASAWAEVMAVTHPEAECAVGSGSSLEGAIRLAEQATSSGPLTSHPPFVSVFAGRSGDTHSGERDRAMVQRQTADKEKA